MVRGNGPQVVRLLTLVEVSNPAVKHKWRPGVQKENIKS